MGLRSKLLIVRYLRCIVWFDQYLIHWRTSRLLVLSLSTIFSPNIHKLNTLLLTKYQYLLIWRTTIFYDFLSWSTRTLEPCWISSVPTRVVVIQIRYSTACTTTYIPSTYALRTFKRTSPHWKFKDTKWISICRRWPTIFIYLHKQICYRLYRIFLLSWCVTSK